MSQLKLFHLQDSSKLKEEEEDGLEENGSGDPLDPGDALKRKLQSIIIQIDLLWGASLSKSTLAGPLLL